jgi:hypothetical protein
MNYGQILKRAWRILWSYRALWIFGIILALVSPTGNLSNSVNWQSNQEEVARWNLPDDLQSALDELNNLFPKEMSPETFRTIITWAIVGGLVILIVMVIFAVLGYVAETALIRMVDRYESSGEKLSIREGFRLGWSRAAWRLFLVKLLVFLPVAVIFIGLFACAAFPVILSVLAGDQPTVSGIIATIGLVFLVIFLGIVIGIALSLVMEIVYRTVVLEETEVMEGLRRGFRLVRNNLKGVGLMWLILVGIQIAFSIALIPVVFLLLFVGLIIGGGAGVGVYYFVQTFAGNLASLISALMVGAWLFMTVLGLPTLFISGLFEVYLSSTWTLTYRALVQPALPEAADTDEGLDGGGSKDAGASLEIVEPDDSDDNLADSPNMDQS